MGRNEAEQRAGSPDPLRIAILEVGAGGNVTTVRRTSESELAAFVSAGAEARLLRINPELPLGDSERLLPGGDLEDAIIIMMGQGLETLHKINAAMPESLRCADAIDDSLEQKK